MNRLSVRLSLAFLLVAWLAIAGMVVVVQRTVETGFQRYVTQRESGLISQEQTERLTTYYAEHGSWAGVTLTTTRGQGQGGRGAELVLLDSEGRVVASTGDMPEGTVMDGSIADAAVPLLLGGDRIGWLYRQTPGMERLGIAETLFLQTANQTLLATAVLVSVVALAVGILLAWYLSRPLDMLTKAAGEIADGQFGRQVEPSGTVETASLAEAFNNLTNQLAEAEGVRRRMAADIAHELRTPVTVLRGQIEAMRDGVLPADQITLAVAYDQTLHLGRLVDDLRLLTLAEAGQISLDLQPVQPGELVEAAVLRFMLLAQDAGVNLRSEASPVLPTVVLDSARIRQVFDNLLSNALRHTVQGGDIIVGATAQGSKIRFTVANTGQISERAAEHMLERFWRADDARHRDSGGSGLGLPIARQLVALHSGHLTITTTATQVVFAFTIPLNRVA